MSENLSTKKLKFRVRLLISLGISFLVIGSLIFLLYIIFACTKVETKTEFNDISFILISLGLGLTTLSFSVLSITHRKMDKNERFRDEIKDIYSLYKNILVNNKYVDLFKIINDLSIPYFKEFSNFFNLFKGSDLDPEKFLRAKKRNNKVIFENNICKFDIGLMEQYDPGNLTITSVVFKNIFRKLLLDLEELAFLCINYGDTENDIIYHKYVTPYLVNSYRKLLPFVHYFGFDGYIINFTLFAYNNL